MSKKTDTWMPLLIDLYMGDTGHLTTEQHGAYLLLLMQAWKKGGVLPNNDATLATTCRMTPAKWRASRDVLLEFFTLTEDGKGLTQKRLSEELQRAKGNTEKRAQAGAKGAAKRWQGDGKTDGNAMAKPLANPSQNDGTPPTPTPIGDTCTSPRHSAGAPEDDDPPEAGGQPKTPAGAVCGALRRAGIPNTNPGHPRLLTLLDAGATPPEFLAFAAKAINEAADPFAYVLGAVEGERKRAANTAEQLHRGPMPAAGDDRKSRQLVTAGLLTGALRTAPQQPQPITEVFDVESRLLAP